MSNKIYSYKVGSEFSTRSSSRITIRAKCLSFFTSKSIIFTSFLLAITYGDLMKVMPFGSSIDAYDLTGQELYENMENSFKNMPERLNKLFLQVSGNLIFKRSELD